MPAIVYVTTNLINGRKYLGKRCHKKRGYLGSGIALNEAIKKYGKDNFHKVIIAEYSTLEEAAAEEKRLSILWDVVNSSEWYNVIPGGTGGSQKGRILSEETKKRISDAKKGTPSWNAGLKGKNDLRCKLSTEVRDKISRSNKGKKGVKGKDHPLSKRVIFLDKHGQKYYTKGIGQFCRENGISESNIRWRLWAKKFDLPTKDGWTVKYEE